MAKKAPNVSYFESRPDVVKVFEDLEAYHDFCRFELLPFNPADLYNRASYVWRRYENRNKPRDQRKHGYRNNRKPLSR